MIERAVAYTIIICGGPIILFGGLALLVYRGEAKEHRRKLLIARRVDDWGEPLCRALLQKQIDVDMTEEMVFLAWGAPDEKEFKQKTRRGERYRWKYANTRGKAIYVWVTDGVVNKIEM